MATVLSDFSQQDKKTVIKNPTISVIVPVYMVEDYLDECIKSILIQTYRYLEIILVDDGSTDSCPQKCDEWANKDKRICVIHKKNGGLSSARNAGLKIATGDYIGFVDSDDILEEHMYEKLLSGFSMTENVAITSVRILRFIDGNLSDFKQKWAYNNPHIIEGKRFSQEIIEQTCSVPVCNKLYHADICKKVSFKEERNNEDTLFNYYIGKELKKKDAIVVELPYPAYYYRLRPDSICTTTRTPLIFDKIENLDEIIIDSSTSDTELSMLAKRIKIHEIYLFLDSLILNKEWKPLYYSLFRNELKTYSFRELWSALSTNDLCYALMHQYCPWIRTFLRKLFQHIRKSG